MNGEQRRSVRESLSTDGIVSDDVLFDGAHYCIHMIEVSAGGLSIAMAKQPPARRNRHV